MNQYPVLLILLIYVVLSSVTFGLTVCHLLYLYNNIPHSPALSLVQAGCKSAQNRWHSLIWCTLFPPHDCRLVLQQWYSAYSTRGLGFSRFINRWLECRMHPGEEICCPFSLCHYLCLTGPDADVTTLPYLNNISRCCMHCRDGGTQIGWKYCFLGHSEVFLQVCVCERMLLLELQSLFFRKALNRHVRWPERNPAIWRNLKQIGLNIDITKRTGMYGLSDGTVIVIVLFNVKYGTQDAKWPLISLKSLQTEWFLIANH